MRGQASVETLILIGVIVLTATSIVYAGNLSREVEIVKSAASLGAENAIIALEAEYGVTIWIEKVSFKNGEVSISLLVVGGPPPHDQTIENEVREDALRFIHQAIAGDFPRNAYPVKTSYYTYDVVVEVERVVR